MGKSAITGTLGSVLLLLEIFLEESRTPDAQRPEYVLSQHADVSHEYLEPGDLNLDVLGRESVGDFPQTVWKRC